mmetsp:Transcript_48064/g.126941  ORF Transcript_48064/g.126941 Transcript_48064/m.126941 type:complete len:113 (-) Transcript_48064:266-604(-)
MSVVTLTRSRLGVHFRFGLRLRERQASGPPRAETLASAPLTRWLPTENGTSDRAMDLCWSPARRVMVVVVVDATGRVLCAAIGLCAAMVFRAPCVVVVVVETGAFCGEVFVT